MKLKDLINSRIVATYAKIIISVSDYSGATHAIFQGTLGEWTVNGYMKYMDCDIEFLSGHMDYLSIVLDDHYLTAP